VDVSCHRAVLAEETPENCPVGPREHTLALEGVVLPASVVLATWHMDGEGQAAAMLLLGKHRAAAVDCAPIPLGGCMLVPSGHVSVPMPLRMSFRHAPS